LDFQRGLAPPLEIHERPQPLLLLFFVWGFWAVERWR